MNALQTAFGGAARRIAVIVGVMLLVVLVACGGGDEDSDDGGTPTTADPTTAAASGGDSDGGGDDGDAGASSDSITAEFLTRFFGLPASFVTDSQRDCIDAALAPDFPNGLPADATLTEELIDTIDLAAESCGVGNLTS